MGCQRLHGAGDATRRPVLKAREPNKPGRSLDERHDIALAVEGCPKQHQIRLPMARNPPSGNILRSLGDPTLRRYPQATAASLMTSPAFDVVTTQPLPQLALAHIAAVDPAIDRLRRQPDVLMPQSSANLLGRPQKKQACKHTLSKNRIADQPHRRAAPPAHKPCCNNAEMSGRPAKQKCPPHSQTR
ncbi:hypothetical protein AA23498_2097 [Acetobacter nitrogenifigens DSM 23921 = NBRC 105050]|uniref:Uncharacterized protein n=1 Tax=Acetobacter nitrogenifigens DSM 23921 = NBRC 105050 TaxID=1120919 RepID=A0A511XF10_9PROT|nr:hypothetical protein [Acetobacter nitrogenifigens]GBQ94717.1 hypothetical protein AA23498_2097 [Acetobacter nitrogenifigens DSM 23921 = NBRC 105050]GEN61543.1 hypothetical protein ANI02nite_34270 [Acetobacter nitrogenifigens DSM 23921 = NBRC 105050]